ncbi:hypothetical protein CONLIGDRAFT_673457 [Coniochaeta ligniaria NRRL 30616]|uniref:Zn(2)-C6 fungal-type domain-containing protein n=1 Tax=Coniochaeta ligniaria NRRL 30616 TaxID=1408157 RepID=A0A1J7J6E0_9PEZI|nr:hypothetical protein CONLIGDRAFT_673457 [Coniochaeta ligniaria NRRL 30616]
MAGTSSPASSTSPNSASHKRQRLPVNPRRNKVPEDKRRRVATACNHCNVRRVKCSGDNPCRQCLRASRECQYPEAVEKVTVTKTEWERLKRRCAELESLDVSRNGSASQEQHLLSPVTAHNIPPTPSPLCLKADGLTHEHTSQPTEGRLLQDTDGTARYLGETSGATFLDNLKSFMFTIFPLAFQHGHPATHTPESGTAFLASVGRYQTQDSRPLQLPAVDPMWLPSRTEMTFMLAALRYFIQDGNGDFQSGGVFFWGDLSTVPLDPRVDPPTGGPGADAQQRNLAFFHTAFAFATHLDLTTANSKLDGKLGETFFARARMLLGNPLDITTYISNDVSVLALMALYLVENNRRDAAYIYISTAMHISIMNGVHRGWSVDEVGKRTFWTVYILDRWLSCLMGRPPTILDDAIRLEMPEDTPGMPPAAGLTANIELARISGYIVCSSYRVTQRGQTADRVECYLHRALELLSNWRLNLPASLQLSDDPPFSSDRACCALHMAQGQLIILTVRPIFFMAVKKAVADWFVSGQWDIEDHAQITLIRNCSDVARRNLRLGRWLGGISPAGKLLLPDLHHIFNAAIILMLHHIVFINLRTKDVVDVAFAIECFEKEAGTGSKYGKDCAKVLQDLWALVQRLRNLMIDGGSNGKDLPLPGEHILASLSNTGAHASIGASIGSLAAPHTRDSQQSQPQTGGLLYQPQYHELATELATWINSDDMQFYNNFLI